MNSGDLEDYPDRTPAPEPLDPKDYEIACLKLRNEQMHHRIAVLEQLANKKLQEDNATKDARIAELEAAGTRLGDAAVEGALTSIEAVTELAEAKARIAELETVKIASAEINVMTSYVRGYIAALETACDPNGTIRENYVLCEENRGLRTECNNLSARAERAEARIAELETERAKLSSFHDMLTKLSHALARAELAEARAEQAEAVLAIVQSKGGLKAKASLLASENGCLRAELSQTKRDLKDWQDSSEAYRHDAEKAEARVAELEGEQAHLQFCLNSRDDFMSNEGLWMKYVDTLPHRKAGVVGGWSETNQIAYLPSRAERAEEQAHYANGVADLAMKHRNSAEAERDAMREALQKINDLCKTDPVNPFLADKMDRVARAALNPSPAGREG